MPAQRRAAGTGPQFLQVQTTTDSRAEAVELAQGAVEERLAACAQVAGPIVTMGFSDRARSPGRCSASR
jgi:periplasmic divalent cation tolerance protein